LPDVIVSPIPTIPTTTTTPTTETSTPRGTTNTTIINPTEISTAVLVESLPTFPDFNTLTCDGLNAEISRITNIVSTTRFADSNIANLYNNALSSAKNVYTSKCNSSATNVSVKTETQLPSPIGGGGIGGGGGLGLGEEPTDETGAVAETPKTNYNWLIVLLLLGSGIYMLRKK
jgi:hypothetical protein